jgi:hypothetical protein
MHQAGFDESRRIPQQIRRRYPDLSRQSGTKYFRQINDAWQIAGRSEGVVICEQRAIIVFNSHYTESPKMQIGKVGLRALEQLRQAGTQREHG